LETLQNKQLSQEERDQVLAPYQEFLKAKLQEDEQSKRSNRNVPLPLHLRVEKKMKELISHSTKPTRIINPKYFDKENQLTEMNNEDSENENIDLSTGKQNKSEFDIKVQGFEDLKKVFMHKMNA